MDSGENNQTKVSALEAHALDFYDELALRIERGDLPNEQEMEALDKVFGVVCQVFQFERRGAK